MKTGTLAFDAKRVATPAAQSQTPWALVWGAVVARWHAAFGGGTIDSIDDATLRDLGLSRSELPSCTAEARGRAPLTRLRIDQYR